MQWDRKLSRVEQLECYSIGPATSAVYGAVVLLDDAGNALFRILNSALTACSEQSDSTGCPWKPSGPVAAMDERQLPRARRLLVAVAVPAARSFSAVATRAGECRGSPSARGRVSRAAISQITRNHNESTVRGHEQIASRRETESENVNDDDVFLLVCVALIVLCIDLCALRSVITERRSLRRALHMSARRTRSSTTAVCCSSHSSHTRTRVCSAAPR